MAVPTITNVSPSTVFTAGNSLVEIRGTGFREWVVPPPSGYLSGPYVSPVEVLFGGVAGYNVGVVSSERLFVRIPPCPLPVVKPEYGQGAVDIVLRNLNANGVPIAGELVTLPNGLLYQRAQLAIETDFARVTRALVRLMRQQIIVNVSPMQHSDFDLNTADLLNIVDVPTLPALVIFGPTIVENRLFSISGRVYQREDDLEQDRFDAPETDDLIYSFVGITDQKLEALNLQSLVRTFFKNNKWLYLDRDPANLAAGKNYYDLVLDTTVGIGFNVPPDQKSNLRSFSGSFIVRGFDHEAVAGFPLSNRVERTHVVLPPQAPTVDPNSKEIVTFAFPNGVGLIGDSTVRVPLPYGTNVTALIPTIVHTGASVSPPSGAPQNFTSPVTFTVTAADGSTKQYVVTADVAAIDDAEIVAFAFPQGAGIIDGQLIDVEVPASTDRAALSPAVAIIGLSVAPVSGAPQDFSSTVQWSWDATAHEAFKTYTYSGDDYISYVGSAPVIAARVGLVDSYNLAGLALFVLGREDKRIYDRLREHFGTAGADGTREITGWYNDGWNADSHETYVAHSDLFSEVNPYWYDLGSQGDLTLDDGTVSERAYAFDAQNIIDVHARGDLVIPTIADHGQIDDVLANPTATTALKNNIVALVASRGYDGIDLNFESGTSASKAAFTAFVTSLATALHLTGKRLVVTLQPAANPTQENALMFDYAALGASPADRLKIMAYDNFDAAVPGPIASLPWIESVLQHAITTRAVPSTKIQLALHTYGWTWKDISGTWTLQSPFESYRAILQHSGTVPYVVTAPDASTKTYDVSVSYPVAGSTTMKIGTNFWYHTSLADNWSGESAMIAGIDWASAYGAGVNGVAAQNIWNPTWLAELAPYSTLRFMDWSNTNWSQLINWSDRMLPTSPNNYEVYSDGLSVGPNPGVAYEWLIDLANRTQKDLWLCVPHRANSGFWTSLATLVHTKLSPDLKLYIEYSNETWNGSFGQFSWINAQAVTEGLPGSNQYYQGQSYCVRQSLRIFDAFQAVFGPSAMGTRVIRVFSYGGNMDTGRQALRDVYQSGVLNPTGQVIDMIAMAPYIGSELDGGSPTIQAQFHQEILDREAAEIGELVADAAEFSIGKIGAYEGGQHLLINSQMWSENPAIYDEYRFMLDKWSVYFDLFVHYTHTSRWTNSVGQSSWGAVDHTGQSPAAAHKYRAIVDWLAAHP